MQTAGNGAQGAVKPSLNLLLGIQVTNALLLR